MVLFITVVAAIFILALSCLFVALNFLVSQKLVGIRSKINLLEDDLGKYLDYDKYLRRKNRENSLHSVERITESIEAIQTLKYVLIGHVKKNTISYKNRAEELSSFLSNYTVEYVEQCRKKYSEFFSDRGLDASQIEAVVKDDASNLVIAPAGSGKTRTLTSRIAYLAIRGIAPNKILALAYTNKARDEMEYRLKGEFGLGEVRVTTLHSLGFQLVRKLSPNLKDDVADDEKQKKIIQDAFNRFLESDRAFGLDVLQFIAEWDVREETDPEEADIEQKCVTIKRDKVDSIAEREIANFLFLNQVDYEHAPVAEWADRSSDYKRYHPDFFLPDYNLYLEHWGIDRDGTVAPWFRDDRENN